ncbi:MAG TPA: hypothetical protein VF941_08890 [Clostridia bacterium]
MKSKIIFIVIFIAFILLSSALLIMFSISSAYKEFMEGTGGQNFHCP